MTDTAPQLDFTQAEDQTPAPATVIAPADLTTPAGFQARRGDRLIEGRRPATWLDDAIAAEHRTTRRMGLLDKPARGVAGSA